MNVSFFRRTMGLHWRRSYWLPTISGLINTVATILAAVVFYLGVALVTYATRAEAAETDAQQTTIALITLLNGQGIQSTDGQWAARCENVVSVTK